eukprot:1146910-Pelagomonas_calceolata.AAC.1
MGTIVAQGGEEETFSSWLTSCPGRGNLRIMLTGQSRPHTQRTGWRCLVQCSGRSSPRSEGLRPHSSRSLRITVSHSSG